MPTQLVAGVQRSPAPQLLQFTVTVAAGTGSTSFGQPLNGLVYHRQITPPVGSGAFSYYVQNNNSVLHDVHTATGPTDNDDLALYIDERTFYIVNAATDGTYTVNLWIA